MHLPSLINTATQAAVSAGKIIQQYLDTDIAVERKEGGTSEAAQVVTAVDRASERVILDHLMPTCDAFDIACLSEETEDDGARFEQDFFWCIDPMDGTLPFIRKQPGFSVSIALVAKDGTPHLGVVFDPSTNNLYHAVKGQGARKNRTHWEIKRRNAHLTYVADRKLKETPRAAEIEALLQEQATRWGLSGVQEMSGAGSVLNAIRVLEHGPACIFKFPKEEQGGGSLWDFAATACIYHELGLPATNFAGGRLDLNRQDGTFMNHEGVFYGNGASANDSKFVISNS